MQAKSPSSIAVSLGLHVFGAAVLFLTTMYVSRQEKVPVIFELVAGPPTAPDELVAPAKGNTTKVVAPPAEDVDLPEEADVPEATPSPPAKVEPVAKNPPPKPVAEKVATVKPKEVKTPTKDTKPVAKTSFKDFQKTNPTKTPAKPGPAKKLASVPRIDVTGIAGGVKGGSPSNTRGGGGGKALSRAEQNALDTYISFLLNALKEAHEPPSGVNDSMEAKVTFDITASGRILAPRISKSSGDVAFDESVLEAFRSVRSIGPTPNGKADTWTVTFRMKDLA